MDEAIHISQQERIERMLEHMLIPEYRKAGFLGEDLSHNILQQMPDLKGDGFVRAFDNRFYTDLIDEYEEYCQDSRRQSVSDFINLAVDYDRDADSKRIAERLAEMGHSMQLLSILEDALLLVKEDSARGKRYYEILRARFFDVYNKTNEDAFLSLGISSATYYRNIKPAIRLLAANLWCVIIPDLIIAEKQHEIEMNEIHPFEPKMRAEMRVI